MQMSFFCNNCFNSETLKDFIKINGEPGHCDFCGNDSQYCIEPSKLEGLFLPLVSLYEEIVNFMPMHDLKENKGEFLYEKLSAEWDVFCSHDIDKHNELLEEMGFSTNQLVESEDEYWGDDLEYNADLKKRWDAFREEIRHQNRFSPEHTLKLLEELLPYVINVVRAKEPFYRARACKGPKLSPDDVGSPLPSQASHGRGNPEGISYLYLASDEDTALSEVKPYLGKNVTIGKFIIPKDLSVIDLRNPCIADPFKYGDKLKHLVENMLLLRIVGNELSKPIQAEESRLDYLPLQYLCELVKKNGYDGVIYKSSVSDGHNLLLFSPPKNMCKETSLYEVTKVIYEKHLAKDSS